MKLAKIIKGKKVDLHPLGKKDFPQLFKWINNPKIAKYWYGRDRPRSITWIEKHYGEMIKDKNIRCFIIHLNQKPIGAIFETLYTNDDKEFLGRIEIDLFIGEIGEWSKGYGTDALRSMIRYAFKTQKAQRIFLTPRVTNSRAINVYGKVGFRKEGILRNYEKFEGKWIDCVMMSIIRDEFHE